MNVVTVTIKKSGDMVYEPSNQVRRGQTVRFVLDQTNGPAWARVTPPACLVATLPVTLDQASATSPVYEDPVSESAAFMTYVFTVEVPPVVAKPHLGSELETKNGNLDVTTDPPEL